MGIPQSLWESANQDIRRKVLDLMTDAADPDNQFHYIYDWWCPDDTESWYYRNPRTGKFDKRKSWELFIQNQAENHAWVDMNTIYFVACVLQRDITLFNYDPNSPPTIFATHNFPSTLSHANGAMPLPIMFVNPNHFMAMVSVIAYMPSFLFIFMHKLVKIQLCSLIVLCVCSSLLHRHLLHHHHKCRIL
jgi:hypothetical protein